MFKKYFLILWVFFLSSNFCLLAQNTVEVIVPKEIRELPENFKEDYTSKKYDYTEHISWSSRIKAWFIDLLKDFLKVSSEKAGSIFYWLRVAFYAVVTLVAVYIIARLFLRKEGRWIFRKNPEEINLDNAIHEDIQSVNFKALIASAEAQKNYREAVKYSYFYMLKKLDEAKIINFDPQKTTYDYQLELDNTKFNTLFNKAAYYYTYIWYGEFTVDESEYQTTSNVFSKILKSI